MADKTADEKVRSFCDLLAKGIKSLGQDIKNDERTIRNLEAVLSKLQSQKADPAVIQQVKQELEQARNTLELDQAQLSAFQDEFSADCP